PEIDAAIVGMRAGETRSVPFRFVDDHRREELRGRGGSAQVELVEVKEKVLPELDAEFAKSLGEFASLAALRAELRRELEARRGRRTLEVLGGHARMRA